MELAGVDLISRAQTGDGEAFRVLTEPYRRELEVHCYRMLGSLQDAEEALQDTLLDAWRGLSGFDGRASIRTPLWRRCSATPGHFPGRRLRRLQRWFARNLRE